jgi:SAM-dependent methyltransferase
MKVLSPPEIKDKRIIELGSYDVNGSLRPYIESNGPKEYIGVDLYPGKYVDVLCYAEDVLGVYGPESFDIIVTTEMLEHVFNWRKIINNMKIMCKSGGIILITTRSYGFGLHGWPYDHWRYETHDMKYIFSDFQNVIIESDPDKGVFVKARKPQYDFRPVILDDYYLYNIVYDLRIR